jgi:hypothetical protein
MQQLQLHMDDLHKPLKVTFLGGEKGDIQEEAVDEGMLLSGSLWLFPWSPSSCLCTWLECHIIYAGLQIPVHP